MPKDDAPEAVGALLRTESTYEVIGALLMRCLLLQMPLVLPMSAFVFRFLLEHEPSVDNTSLDRTVREWLHEVSLCDIQMAQSMRKTLHEGTDQAYIDAVTMGDPVFFSLDDGKNQMQWTPTTNTGYVIAECRSLLRNGLSGNRLKYLRSMKRGMEQCIREQDREDRKSVV